MKLNLLFLLTSIPLVTIPPAALALSRVVRGLLDDKPGRAYAYWAEFKRCWAPGWGAFLLTALPPEVGGALHDREEHRRTYDEGHESYPARPRVAHVEDHAVARGSRIPPRRTA